MALTARQSNDDVIIELNGAYLARVSENDSGSVIAYLNGELRSVNCIEGSRSISDFITVTLEPHSNSEEES